ncbi:hypothetical protein OG311_40465 (plasmid) [Streptomyces sp. NBC_01343]|uniref:hypothetical protein n=1 Tax=Streptomyces sp. NBC_01343 TaxID=2903832 RepID=UPI002E1061EE|nr:hypothetical protein OG311_00005 [Streptomyces sp. NBC_01343]WSI28599.1 hypothetical protein OG311_37595 [Streptomyces sp. NBC_01343]WSI29638.1 hypothetical protein OG311_40465 [Streptomyces sp. NBC_01343]
MSNTKRNLAATTRAVTAIVSSGASQAVTDGPVMPQTRSLINSLGIAGNANSNDDSSQNDNVSAGNNQQFSGHDNSSTVTADIAGQSVDQSIYGLTPNPAAFSPAGGGSEADTPNGPEARTP